MISVYLLLDLFAMVLTNCAGYGEDAIASYYCFNAIFLLLLRLLAD